MKKIIIIIITLSFVTFFSLLYYNNSIDKKTLLLEDNLTIASKLQPYLTLPFEFQHSMYSTIDSKPFLQGSGIVDFTQGCNLNAKYTGSLYEINYKTDKNMILSQTEKRETKTKTEWTYLENNVTNHNSILFSLLGNNANMLCSISNLNKILVSNNNNKYTVDLNKYKALLITNLENINVNLYKDISKDKVNQLLNNSLSNFSNKNITILIENLDSITIKLIIKDKNNNILEDIILRTK
jgi:hypothetical protein